MAKVTAFRVGHCSHPSFTALKGSGIKSRCFPARAYLIETRQGPYLWDTGYADHFRDATSKGIYRLYPLITPISFDSCESLQGQLKTYGVQPKDIHTLVLSHFHADHVAGVRDFPKARLLASSFGWEAVRRLSGFNALRRAFLPGLLPPDVEARLVFIDGWIPSALPEELAPFTHGRDISGTGEIFIVSLPGHAVGHLGAFVRGDNGWTLLASDAAWVAENYQQLCGPAELSFFIQHNRAEYYETLRRLHALHNAGKVIIRLSHESAPDFVKEARP